ncbi:DUF6153 family protein [Streptomyces cavernicola]|uniref:DUF6153 family protein n=1 Tax=Streptomyces cavernicola TaxID=3043613 RepID=A0ABT6S7T6_9ACTN|nr:DUF6153 family protein [Streptomyces sp. B-S-A6]MDI3404165.1 DUF6153 family protein [Streptomyces sp. B-S-A6]
MVTATRTSSPRRARTQVAGPLRLFWFAVLILGLLYTHGVSSETAAHHVAPGTSTTATASAAQDGHAVSPDEHDSGSAEHAAEECLSNQPQQGVDLPEPCSTPVSAAHSAPVGSLTNSRSVDAGSSSSAGRDPAILRV